MYSFEKPLKEGDYVALEYGGGGAWGVYLLKEEKTWLGKKTGKLVPCCRASKLDKETAELWAAASNA